MDIKSKISNIKSKISVVLGEIRSFNFLFVLLGRKKKKLLDKILLNEGLIKHYESKISVAVKEIKISKIKIENIEQNNKQIREYISNIRKLE